jgi:hypothetical protein
MAKDWFTAGLQADNDTGIKDLNTLSNLAYHLAATSHLEGTDQRMRQLTSAFQNEENPVMQSLQGAFGRGTPLAQLLLSTGNVDAAMKFLPGYSVAGETMFQHNPYGAAMVGGSYNLAPENKRTVMTPQGDFTLQGNPAKPQEQKVYEWLMTSKTKEDFTNKLGILRQLKQSTHISNVVPKDPELMEMNKLQKEDMLIKREWERRFGTLPKPGIAGGTDYPTDPATGQPMTNTSFVKYMNDVKNSVLLPGRTKGKSTSTKPYSAYE